MAELTQSELLQPSLLDRLTDDEPERKQESRDRRVLSLRRLRAAVLRDLAWLLNTGNLEAVQDLTDYQDAARSVLNYGVSDLTGRSLSSLDVHALERTVKLAIQEFEPRLLRRTVKVRLASSASDENARHNALAFEIEAQMWAHPTPMRLFLRSELDLEDGSFSIAETG